MQADWTGALERARAHSPFLGGALERQPDLAAMLAHGEGEAALAAARRAGAGSDDAGVALRRERLALATALGIGDLAGAIPLAQVMGELSAFADRALDTAIAAAFAERVPDAPPRGFVAIALGKHGAGELNYSSDIDPIFLYDPDTIARRDGEEPDRAATRIARRVVELLADRTAEGYVFRVDLRLRPQAEITPPAMSVARAVRHYQSAALPWERAAFVRARVAAGDRELGDRFLGEIRPFIWRSQLDFGAVRDIRALTRRIRDEFAGPPVPDPGSDVKRGRGGIREVEFLVQTQQLIHGGRDPALQVRGLHDALAALAGADLMAGDEARALGAAYDVLRTAEHRLQMHSDRQTHALPKDPALLGEVAALAGFARVDGWLDHLRPHAERIAAAYDALVDERPAEIATVSTPGTAPVAVGARNEDAPGFDVAGRVAGWEDGRFAPLRSAPARTAFGEIRAALVAALAAAPDPDRAVTRFETLLERMASAVLLFELLAARPTLVGQLVRILTLAEPLGDELARNPEHFDALVDRSAFDLPGSVDDLAAAMRLPDAPYEDRLERLRRVVGDTRFRLGVQLIERTHDPLAIAEGYARVAEAALIAGTEAAGDAFADAHGRIAAGGLVVLGLGRLGGGALTHASDLDLIYLFTAPLDAQSDGARPLGATLYYNRLSQRVTAALSVPTAAGALYEVDTRLRPQGMQGPPAASLDAFARYQQEEAWTWEHMALARGRVLVGSADDRAAAESAIARILDRERDPATLRADVLAMRARMAEHKPPTGPLDVKLARGGLVDIEFIVHFLQLRDRTGQIPDLVEAIATFAAASLVPGALGDAHRLLTRALVAGRLLAPGNAPASPAAAQVLATACGQADFAALETALLAARHAVAAAWRHIFDEDLEIA